MRNILVHHHIFKNAGSSFNAILDHNFGRDHLNIEASVPWGVLSHEKVVRFVHLNPQMKAISSHTARLLPKEMDGLRFHPMLFLRHPLDRVGSVYSFERRQPSNSPSIGAHIARKSDIKEYVIWRLKKGNGAVIRNFHVAFISGRENDMRFAEATREDLERAMERINQMKVFGLVELFQESLHKFKNYYESLVGSFAVKDFYLNQSPDREAQLESRVRMLQQQLGADVYNELIEKNSLDMELYHLAKTWFLQSSGIRSHPKVLP